jgi:hypothetical protein
VVLRHGPHWAYNNYVLGGIKPDGSRYYNDNFARGFPVRITGQVSKRDRVTGLTTYSTKGRGPAVTAPEATLVQRLPYEIIGQIKWTSTLGSNVLFETVREACRRNTERATPHRGADRRGERGQMR